MATTTRDSLTRCAQRGLVGALVGLGFVLATVPAVAQDPSSALASDIAMLVEVARVAGPVGVGFWVVFWLGRNVDKMLLTVRIRPEDLDRIAEPDAALLRRIEELEAQVRRLDGGDE